MLWELRKRGITSRRGELCTVSQRMDLIWIGRGARWCHVGAWLAMALSIPKNRSPEQTDLCRSGPGASTWLESWGPIIWTGFSPSPGSAFPWRLLTPFGSCQVYSLPHQPPNTKDNFSSLSSKQTPVMYSDWTDISFSHPWVNHCSKEDGINWLARSGLCLHPWNRSRWGQPHLSHIRTRLGKKKTVMLLPEK